MTDTAKSVRDVKISGRWVAELLRRRMASLEKAMEAEGCTIGAITALDRVFWAVEKEIARERRKKK